MSDVDKIQNEILTTLYDLHKDDPFAHFNTDSLVGEVKDSVNFDAAESDIDYALNRLDEEFLVDHDPAIGSRGTITLRPRGVDKLQQEAGNTFLENNDQFYILAKLEEMDRENPGSLQDGGDFRDELELDDSVVDLNMWYLIEKGWVDASRVVGTPTYTALKIDSMGRQALERFRAQPEQQQASSGGETSPRQQRKTDQSIDVEGLLAQEESVKLEFKETFLYDVYQEQPNTNLKEDAVEEVCAFANTEGGILIIGVDDDAHEVQGLERDLSLMPEGKDEFERQINQEISNRIGSPFASMFTRVQFREVGKQEVCVVTVDRAPEPVYCDETFFVRNGSSSVPLDTQDAVSYINRHWP